MLPGAPALHGDKDAATARISRPERNVVAELHSELGDVAAGFAAADFIHEQTYRTQRVQHVALETHASIASIDDDGRLQIRTSSQVPFLVRRTLCRRVRPAGGADPRGGRPGGRRLRRQAGGAHRGHRGAGRPEAEAPGAAGIHPDRTVHRRHHPAPVHHPAQGRRQQRRPAHRAAAGGAHQHRRLRQPRPGRHVPRLRRVPGRSTSAPTRRWTPTPCTPTPCRPAPSAATG